jgi:hypothetical protein
MRADLRIAYFEIKVCRVSRLAPRSAADEYTGERRVHERGAARHVDILGQELQHRRALLLCCGRLALLCWLSPAGRCRPCGGRWGVLILLDPLVGWGRAGGGLHAAGGVAFSGRGGRQGGEQSGCLAQLTPTPRAQLTPTPRAQLTPTPRAQLTTTCPA